MEGELMPVRRELHLVRYLLAFIITTSLFVVIFTISSSISYLNYEKISSQNNLIKQYLNDLDSVLANSSSLSFCNPKMLDDVSKKLDQVGARLSLLESRLKDDPRVIEQKKSYSELEYKHLQIVKKLNSRCDSEFFVVLFFYDNIIDDKENQEQIDEETDRMSFILGTFKNQDSARIMIYSFDKDLDTPAIGLLKSVYNVTLSPIVLVNEKDFIYLTNIEQLESAMKKRSENLKVPQFFNKSVIYLNGPNAT